MFALQKKRSIGLDIGQASVKAVALAVQGKAVVMTESRLLDTRAQGIVGEEELYTAVAGWLEQVGYARDDINAGLPQYLATTQVADFPPGGSGSLDEMVAYETRQLAGLSEEGFLHDYQLMPPKFGRRNPVLIGICRQSVVQARADALVGGGIRLVDLGMSGTAVANAFFHLNPRSLALEPPQLLLDIGVDSSTMIVVAGGQVLFVGSLLFGAEKFSQALAAHLGMNEENAEKAKLTARLNPKDTESPLAVAARQLDTELANAIENWRSQERPEIGERGFAKIWLSGGGARLAGLDEYLAQSHGCPAELYGPVAKPSLEAAPELVTAYGLALQGLHRGTVEISLCPNDISWLRRRERRFGYLVAAVVFVALFLAGMLFRGHRRLVARQQMLENRMVETQTCETLIPQLEDTATEIRQYEKMLLPFVEKGNRAQRLLLAIHELVQARGEDDWFVYFADEFSFHEGKKGLDEEDTTEHEPRAEVGPGPAVPALIPEAAPGPAAAAETPASFENVIPVEDMAQLQALIAAGFTLHLENQPYRPIREIVKKLNASDLFEGVDLPQQSERAGREDIFESWTRFFAAIRAARGQKASRYDDFTIRMPFTLLDVNKSAFTVNSEDDDGT